MPRRTPELDLQIQVADFLRIATIAPARWWFVPNGGNLSKAQSGRFKAAGLTPGVADLHFAWPLSGHALYGVIEMKAGRGVLTPDQQQFREDMAQIGHGWAECRSLEAVISTLTQWQFPLKRTAL